MLIKLNKKQEQELKERFRKLDNYTKEMTVNLYQAILRYEALDKTQEIFGVYQEERYNAVLKSIKLIITDYADTKNISYDLASKMLHSVLYGGESESSGWISNVY